MSSKCKIMPGSFRRDIRKLLLAAEVGQKEDILSYSSGHLRTLSLNQSSPLRESFWRTSQSLKETSNQTRTKALTSAKKKEMKACPFEFSTDTALEDADASRSFRGQAADRSDKTEDTCEDIWLRTLAYSSLNSPPPEPFDQIGLSDKGRLKAIQRFGRQVIAKQDLWPGRNVAQMHERKLQKELKKLSERSWPSRDRLAVFSDVFDDVCEGSPVFGRILREIKTDYDLYVNHLMASQSLPVLDNMPLETSLRDLGNDKVRQMELEEVEKEIFRLEQEVERGLEENKRLREELQNVPAIIGPEDSDMTNAPLSGHTSSVQSKRLQVLNKFRENQQLEEEFKEKLVSSVITGATKRCIKDLKREIMRLIASSDRLQIINKDLENNINMVLNREKVSKAMRRALWHEIYCDLQTKSEASSTSEPDDNFLR